MLPDDQIDATAADIKRIPRDKWPKTKPKLTAEEIDQRIRDQGPQPELGADIPGHTNGAGRVFGAQVPLGLFHGGFSPPKPEVLIPNLLYRDSFLTLMGQSKVGKTLIMLDMAISFANGRPWMGFTPERPLTVAYIDGEMPIWALIERSKKIAAHRGLEIRPSGGGGVYFYPFQGFQPKMMAGELVKNGYAIKEIGPDLVIGDNLSAFHQIDAQWYKGENDDRTMEMTAEIWRQGVREFDAPVILVHHATKGNQTEKNVMEVGAGSGALARRTDGTIVIREIITPGAGNDDGPIRHWELSTKLRHWYPDVTIRISRNGPVFDPHVFGSDSPFEDMQPIYGNPSPAGNGEGSGKTKESAEITDSAARQILVHEFAEKSKGMSRKQILDVLKARNSGDLFAHWKSSRLITQSGERNGSPLYLPVEGFF